MITDSLHKIRELVDTAIVLEERGEYLTEIRVTKDGMEPQVIEINPDISMFIMIGLLELIASQATALAQEHKDLSSGDF